MGTPNIRNRIGLIAVLVLAHLLYFRTLQWMVNSWIHSDYYSHGFFILPIAAIIVWSRRHELSEQNPFRRGILVFVAGLALFIGGFAYSSNFLSALSLFLVVPGLVLYFRGKKALRTCAFPLCFLAFMIPLPFLDRVGFWMQSFSARGSAWIISLMGIPITRTGAEIRLENASFVVGMPCSGMNSLIALLALAALFAYILKGPFIRKAMLFLLAVPIAILANLSRLVALLLIGNHWGAEAAMGFLHDAFSPVFFVVSIVFMVVFAKLLRLRLWEQSSNAGELP